MLVFIMYEPTFLLIASVCSFMYISSLSLTDLCHLTQLFHLSNNLVEFVNRILALISHCDFTAKKATVILLR